MEQESYKIGIIGAGPAGCACAYFLGANKNITLIDYGVPMRTVLPTGGGRCNLAYAEFDFMELAKNYPRGEKFLYSIFSRFSTSDTINMFDELGINTYTQDNLRIFPATNKSEDVKNAFCEVINKCNIIKEKALRIEVMKDRFKVVTDNNSYYFDKLVVSTGGHSGYEMLQRIGVTIIEPRASLVGLITQENFSNLMGIVVKDVYNKNIGYKEELLFTHFGVSGPLIYRTSSIFARKDFPYELSFDLCPNIEDLQVELNNNPHKYIKNLLGEYIPHRLSEYILSKLNINDSLKCHEINGNQRDMIEDYLHNFKIVVKSTKKDGETVTSGGVSLNKINPKTMESKEIKNLYFCGEIIDVDGFCGGFNLQNCWSTAYVAAEGIKEGFL